MLQTESEGSDEGEEDGGEGDVGEKGLESRREGEGRTEARDGEEKGRAGA